MVALAKKDQLTRLLRHNLKRARCVARLSAEQLADRSKLPVALIKSYESDMAVVADERHLFALAEALRIPFHELFKIRGSFIGLSLVPSLMLISAVGMCVSILALITGHAIFSACAFTLTVFTCMAALLLPSFIYPNVSGKRTFS